MPIYSLRSNIGIANRFLIFAKLFVKIDFENSQKSKEKAKL